RLPGTLEMTASDLPGAPAVALDAGEGHSEPAAAPLPPVPPVPPASTPRMPDAENPLPRRPALPVTQEMSAVAPPPRPASRRPVHRTLESANPPPPPDAPADFVADLGAAPPGLDPTVAAQAGGRGAGAPVLGPSPSASSIIVDVVRPIVDV